MSMAMWDTHQGLPSPASCIQHTAHTTTIITTKMAHNRQAGLSDFVQFDDETILWTASLILLNHLQKLNSQQATGMSGTRVLELGSGLGHLGMGLKAMGAHVVCTERPQELGHLEASLSKHQNQTGSILDSALALFGRGATTSESAQPGQQPSPPATSEGSIQAFALEWGEEGFNRSPLSSQQLSGTFDYIICSELYYIERLFPELLWTLRKFAGPQTIIWSIFIDRPYSFMFFALMSDEGCWDVESIEQFDDLGLDKELQVHMHRIKLKAGLA